MDKKRPTWDQYFMRLAEQAATRSSCLSDPKGAIIVRDGFVISTGYNGAARGVKSCYDAGFCFKRSLGFKSGEGHEVCKAVHAEANAILMSARMGISTEGSTMYCTHKPCEYCSKLLVNSGVKEIVYKNDYSSKTNSSLYEEAGITIRQFDDNSRYIAVCYLHNDTALFTGSFKTLKELNEFCERPGVTVVHKAIEYM